MPDFSWIIQLPGASWRPSKRGAQYFEMRRAEFALKCGARNDGCLGLAFRTWAVWQENSYTLHWDLPVDPDAFVRIVEVQRQFQERRAHAPR